MGMLDGKVAIVTGAGRGIGREEALVLAREGAAVLVNDLGGTWDGQGSDDRPAEEIAAEIRAAGGRAQANHDSVTDDDAMGRMVAQGVDTFGRLDILVNNAGILRDRMLFNMAPEEFRLVLEVHLFGTFSTMRHACAHWRAEAKAGRPVAGRIVNTSSGSGLLCNPGQANYGAAKAGIAALTQIGALEMQRYGVTVNAIAPVARTRLTVAGSPRINDAGGTDDDSTEAGWDPLSPENVAPMVAFLASDAAAAITGQVFGVFGGLVQRYDGWSLGPELRAGEPGRFPVEEIAARWKELFPEGATAFHSPMETVRQQVASALAAAGLAD